jgi:hypothetical protein
MTCKDNKVLYLEIEKTGGNEQLIRHKSGSLRGPTDPNLEVSGSILGPDTGYIGGRETH